MERSKQAALLGSLLIVGTAHDVAYWAVLRARVSPLLRRWVVWRSKEELPEDLVFHVNYLGGATRPSLRGALELNLLLASCFVRDSVGGRGFWYFCFLQCLPWFASVPRVLLALRL